LGGLGSNDPFRVEKRYAGFLTGALSAQAPVAL
jgi:hypothetical protein